MTNIYSVRFDPETSANEYREIRIFLRQIDVPFKRYLQHAPDNAQIRITYDLYTTPDNISFLSLKYNKFEVLSTIKGFNG